MADGHLYCPNCDLGDDYADCECANPSWTVEGFERMGLIPPPKLVPTNLGGTES